MIYLDCKEINNICGGVCWCRQNSNPYVWIKANVRVIVGDGKSFEDVCKNACCKIGGRNHDRFSASFNIKPENGAAVGSAC